MKDLDWALKQVPVPRKKRPSVFENPKVSAWLDELLLKKEKHGWPQGYIADVLTLLAREHGVIDAESQITETNLNRYMRLYRGKQKPARS